MLNRPTLFAVIGLAIASRLLPHPPNFAFVGALGLFAGCHFRGRLAVLAPLIALLVSDLIGHLAGLRGMGFYNPIVMLTVYGGVAASGLIGVAIREKRGPVTVGLAAVTCSILFFLSSNLGVWAAGAYPLSLSGLVACYAAAVPFFQYTLAGDLFYTALTFGTLSLTQAMPTFPVLRKRCWVRL